MKNKSYNNNNKIKNKVDNIIFKIKKLLFINLNDILKTKIIIIMIIE